MLKNYREEDRLPVLEISNHVSAVHNSRRSIQSKIPVFPVVHVILQKIQEQLCKHEKHEQSLEN